MHPFLEMIGARVMNAILDNVFKGRDPYAEREARIDENLKALELLERTVPPPEPPSMTSKETNPELGESKPHLSGTSQLSAGGKACIPCSADHLSTVAGALSEALRFARTEGIDHPEVLERIALCFDELNIMERVDAAPEKLEQLPEEERTLMGEGTIASRALRHQLTDLKSIQDLESVAAYAQRVRREFRSKLFRIHFGKLQPEQQERVKVRARDLVEQQLASGAKEEANGAERTGD